MLEARNPVRLVVFDCDGTLVDSQATIVTCAQAAFRAEGLAPPSAEAIRRIVGLSLVEAVMELMAEPDPAAAPRLAERYKEAFLEHRARPDFHEPLFPGTRELLDTLLARDFVLGVATGKAMRGLRSCSSITAWSATSPRCRRPTCIRASRIRRCCGRRWQTPASRPPPPC